MERRQVYQYKNFVHADEIRLLVLCPETSTGEIRIKLIHSRLSDSPQYEARSYAWGDLSKSRRVVCENEFIEVTESLFVALQRLRYKDQERIIWADAICINQNTKIEKNHQVALMGRIYSQAHQTLAWIREAPDEVTSVVSGYIFRLDGYLTDQIESYRNGPNVGFD